MYSAIQQYKILSAGSLLTCPANFSVLSNVQKRPALFKARHPAGYFSSFEIFLKTYDYVSKKAI